MSNLKDELHVLSSAYERLGDDNLVVTRCMQHPDYSAATFTWPTHEQLLDIGHKHDPDYDWAEHYRWH